MVAIPRFFSVLRPTGGVAPETLRGLEREGLVSRTAYATVPPRVEYAPTELGLALTEPLALLARWAMVKRAGIEAARRAYDARQAIA